MLLYSRLRRLRHSAGFCVPPHYTEPSPQAQPTFSRKSRQKAFYCVPSSFRVSQGSAGPLRSGSLSAFGAAPRYDARQLWLGASCGRNSRAEAGAALRFLQAPAVARRKNRLSTRGFNVYHQVSGSPKVPRGLYVPARSRRLGLRPGTMQTPVWFDCTFHVTACSQKKVNPGPVKPCIILCRWLRSRGGAGQRRSKRKQGAATRLNARGTNATREPEPGRWVKSGYEAVCIVPGHSPKRRERAEA